MPKSHPRSKNRSSRSLASRPSSRSQGQGADSQDQSWLTGFHSVREALRARRRSLDRLWLRSEGRRDEHEELGDLARSQGVLVEWVDSRDLTDRVGGDGNDQGVALKVGRLPEFSLASMLEMIPKTPEGGRRLIALDGVEDPQNVGALARVAESAGVDGMILTARRAPDLTPAVSRASAGAIEWLPVARVANLARALEDTKKSGFWIVAAGLESSTSLFELDDRILTGDLVIVLGSEGAGMRRSILEQADHRVQIPMRGKIESLNVSTAGAVILYDLLRRSEATDSQRPT